jgi:hypothetical protein
MYTNWLNTSLNWDSVRFSLFLKGAECLPVQVLRTWRERQGNSVTTLREIPQNISEHQSRMDFYKISQCWEGLVNALTCSIRYGNRTLTTVVEPSVTSFLGISNESPFSLCWSEQPWRQRMLADIIRYRGSKKSWHPRLISANSGSILDHNGFSKEYSPLFLMTRFNRCIHSWNMDCSVLKVTPRQMVQIASTIWSPVDNSIPSIDSFSNPKSRKCNNSGLASEKDIRRVRCRQRSIYMWFCNRYGRRGCSHRSGREVPFSSQ